MERLSTANNFLLLTPGVIGKGDADKISVMIYGTGGSLTGLALYVMGPLGQFADITSYLTEITTSLTFLTLFETT